MNGDKQTLVSADEDECVTWASPTWWEHDKEGTLEHNKEGDVTVATTLSTTSEKSSPVIPTTRRKTRVSVSSTKTAPASTGTPTSYGTYSSPHDGDVGRPRGAPRRAQSAPTACIPGTPDLVLTAEAMSNSIATALNQLSGLASFFPKNNTKPTQEKGTTENALMEFLAQQQTHLPPSIIPFDKLQNFMTADKKEEAPSTDVEDSLSSGTEQLPHRLQLFDARLPGTDSEASSPNSSFAILHRPIPIQASGSVEDGTTTSVRSSSVSSYSIKSTSPEQEESKRSSKEISKDVKQRYSNSSPMARMRDPVTQSTSIFDGDASSPAPLPRKTQAQIKAEKQRKWKQRMKIAQKKKRQERRQLEDDLEDTRAAAGGFVELILANVVPDHHEAFFALIHTRCGGVNDAASDSDEESPAVSAASSDGETPRHGDTPNRTKTQRKSKRRTALAKSPSAKVVQRRKLKKSIKMSPARSEATQQTASSSGESVEKSESEGGELGSTKRQPLSSRSSGTDDERRVEVPQDPPSGHPLKRIISQRKGNTPRDPSPDYSIFSSTHNEATRAAKTHTVKTPKVAKYHLDEASGAPKTHSVEGTRAVKTPPTALEAIPQPLPSASFTSNHSTESTSSLKAESETSLQGGHIVDLPAMQGRQSEKGSESVHQSNLGHAQRVHHKSLGFDPTPFEREEFPRLKHSATPNTPDVTSSVPVADPTDKSFVKTFIHEVMSRGVQLHWHKEQASMTPLKVKMHLKPGYRAPNNNFCAPRLGWADTKHPDDKFGIDLFDIQSLDRATPSNLNDYPFAIPSRSIFLKLTRGRDFVFEASSEGEARRLIHGFRWIVARLAFNLVIGNLEVSCELLEVGLLTEDGQSRQRSPQTPLEEARWTKAMDDVTSQLVDKSILYD
jgi:hypothetical protein